MQEHFQNIILPNDNHSQNINSELPIFRALVERFENRAISSLNYCAQDMAECCIYDPYIQYDPTGTALWLRLLAEAREKSKDFYVRLVIIRGGGTKLQAHDKWGYVIVPVIGHNGWMDQVEFDKYKEYLKPYINDLIVLLRWLSYVKE